MDRAKFYKSIRPLFGKLKQSQVNGMEAVLDYWDGDKSLTDLRHLAYIFATIFHETARTMLAIEEYGKGKRRAYGAIDPKTGFAYYGRGLVQLTWASNYKKMGKILDIPLYEQPDLVLDLNISVAIIFEGMMTRKSFMGDFTGKSLENYFNKTKDDPVGARRIVNGTDKAVMIAGYHRKFLEALKAAA